MMHEGGSRSLRNTRPGQRLSDCYAGPRHKRWVICSGASKGFIADIGYETSKILEALAELRETEFPELKQATTGTTQNGRVKYVNDCIIETDEDIRFPRPISNTAERMTVQELDNIKEEYLDEFRKNLEDRFGYTSLNRLTA